MKRKIFNVLFALVLVLSFSLVMAVPAMAVVATAPELGTAKSFAVLGGPAVTLTDSTITGDVGSGFANPDPGSVVSVTTSDIEGETYIGDLVAVAAYNDAFGTGGAYEELAGGPAGVTKSGTLDGENLPPGVYEFAAAAALDGTLTLDADGDPSAVWIFKIGGALSAGTFSVVMDDGGMARNVFWWVANGVTLTDSNFQGTILAGADITVTRGTFSGRALATGEVTSTGTSTANKNPITVPDAASISLNEAFYLTSGTVDVTVFDDAANTNPVVKNVITVYASSDTDSVVTLGNTLTLTETSYNTGIFTSSFTLIPTPPPAAGQVVVTNGDSIYVKYTAVSSVLYTAMALVDTTVPTIDATLTVSGTGGPWSVPPITIIPCTIPVITATSLVLGHLSIQLPL